MHSGYDYRDNSGRAVVAHAPNGDRIACGLLAEELLIAQLHDYGNESKQLEQDTHGLF